MILRRLDEGRSMPDPEVSIIICTRNRAPHLRLTLESMARVGVPGVLPAELLVVDNASTDLTSEVVRSCRLPNMPVRYFHEPRSGKTHALNTGMAAARGDIFLFTDDDVRPPRDWIAGMCAPILSGRAHAVQGGMKIAPHLERPWMSPQHRGMLASTEAMDPRAPHTLVGGNMAFSREVLAKVPAFDPELGPGALGFGDDSLFAGQLQEAGFLTVGALDVEVEHHFEEFRLRRWSLLDNARKRGRSLSYLAHHWHHKAVPSRWALYRAAAATAFRLASLRARRWRDRHGEDGCSKEEMHLVRMASYYRQYLIERDRPRNYTERGLVKLSLGRDEGRDEVGGAGWSSRAPVGMRDGTGACDA